MYTEVSVGLRLERMYCHCFCWCVVMTKSVIFSYSNPRLILRKSIRIRQKTENMNGGYCRNISTTYNIRVYYCFWPRSAIYEQPAPPLESTVRYYYYYYYYKSSDHSDASLKLQGH